jgi:hypothetical protein
VTEPPEPNGEARYEFEVHNIQQTLQEILHLSLGCSGSSTSSHQLVYQGVCTDEAALFLVGDMNAGTSKMLLELIHLMW